MQLSTRYVPHLAVLITLTAVPSYLFRQGRLLVDECRDPAALLQAFAGGGTPDGDLALPNYLQRIPRLGWAARTAPIDSSDQPLQVFAVRAFNPNLVYRPPELHFIHDAAPDRRELEMVEHGAERLPVHRAYYDVQDGVRRRVTVAGYLVVFESKPVRNFYLAEFLASPGQLVRGRKPIWLFFAFGEFSPRLEAAAERALHEALGDAWEQYQAGCLP